MKNKRKLLQLVVLCITSTVVLWNCQKEEMVKETIAKQKESIPINKNLKRVFVNELINKDSLFTQISKHYLSSSISSNVIASKKTFNNNLVVNSDTINIVEKDNYKSYTLRIKRPNTLYDTENLVLEYKNGIKNAYILSYDFTNEWMINQSKGIYKKPEGKIYYSNYDVNSTALKTASKKTESCRSVTISIISPCPCEGHIRSCRCYQQPVTYKTTQVVCGNSGGGNDGDGRGDLFPIGDGDSDSGGGGGPSNPDNNDDDSDSQGNIEDMREFIEFKIYQLTTNLKLNDSDIKWIQADNNLQKALDLYDFASLNRWKEKTNNFTKKAIDALKKGGTVNLEDQIINELTGKAKCVYDKLKNSSTGFKNMIKKFDGDFPVSHLSYSMDSNIVNTINAVTDNSGRFLIEIRLNNNTIQQRTELGLVRTLIHETIHAELYRKVRSVNNTIDIRDFPGIYDYYRRFSRNWQHQQMAAHYKKTIADILETYDQKQNSRQFYEDLAWEGLHGTEAWNQLSNSEITRITKAVNDYKLIGNKSCN